MIIHFIKDQKFIDGGFSSFEEVAPGYNIALMFGNKKKPLKYIKTTRVTRLSNSDLFSLKFYRLLTRSKAIVFHSLHPDFLILLKLFSTIRYKGKIIWIGWGYDYYDLLTENNFELYEPDTKAFFSDIIHAENMPSSDVTNSIKRRINNVFLNKQKMINDIDYFLPVLYEDYQLIKESICDFTPKYMRWNYSNTSRILHDISKINHQNPKDILIGNSATPSNNHLEIFNMLSQLAKVRRRKIIVPLSYGSKEYEKYRKVIINLGENKFGGNFLPLVNFIPMKEYLGIITNCTHIIMNHRRQQGGGNISISIYQGASVFLNEKSIFYTFYKSQGFHIFKVSDIENDPTLLDNLLDQEKIQENRRLLEKNFGMDQIHKNTQKLIAEILLCS